jgi:hypothetical protein
MTMRPALTIAAKSTCARLTDLGIIQILMKNIFLVLSLIGCSTFLVSADDSAMGDAKGDSGNFIGQITAVEEGRDSFTVLHEGGQVKMFAVGAEQKSKLAVGQKVSVSYVNNSSWPLPTRSISILNQ